MPGTATLSDIVDEQKPGVASLSDIDESTPEERATVSKAIASVPYHPPKMEWSSVAPIPEVESEKAEPYSLKKAAVGGLGDILSNPAPGAETGIPSTGPEAARGVENLGTPGKRWRGAGQVASAALQTAAPILGPTAGLEAPVSTAIGMGTGYGASKIAGKVSEKLGAEPETKQVVEDLAFWAPTVAGMLTGVSGTVSRTAEGEPVAATGKAFGGRVAAGVAKTPGAYDIGAKVGPFQAGVSIPRSPAGAPVAELQEPIPNINPGDAAFAAAKGHANAPTDSDVAVAVAAQREHLQATRMASGLPPVEPPAPAPPPPPAPQIGMDQVAKMGEAIAKLPPDLRAQAMVEAHGKLSQVFMQMGKVVNPHDGKLTVITKPEQADKLATDFINGEVERRDKLAEEAQKKAESAQGKSVRKTSGVVEKPVEAAENSNVGLAHVNDIEDVAGTVQSKGETAAAKPNGEQPAATPVAAAKAQTAKMAQEPAPTHFAKGDRVTLQDGSEATIHYSSPGMRLVRLVTEDGRRMTVSGKDVNKLQRVATNVPESAPMATNVPTDIIGEPTAKPRTPGEPLEHGFNTQPAEDLGQAVREATQKTEGALPRRERRKIERTPEEQQTQELFGKARKELGEDASSDQVMARVGELKKAGENSPAAVENSAKPLQAEENKASHISEISPEEAPKFKHRSTQVNIPEESEASQAIEAARSRISKEDLAGDGKDIGGNHVTVRWGLQAADDADLSKLKSYISSLAPFEASLGKTSKFKPSESSDGAAVIQAPIEAPELHKINEEIAKHGDFTEPTFKYSPHATVAYVKPDKADRYTGMSVTHGKKFTVKSISISDRNGGQEEVPLKGSSNLTEAPAKSVEPEHPHLDLGEHAAHTEMVATPTVEKYANENVQMVPTSELDKYKEFDRRATPHPGRDEDVIEKLKADIKANGLKEPLILKYGSDDKKAHLWEGNHRLAAAKELGIKELPVRVITAKKTEDHYGVGVRGHQMTGEVPADLKPSDIGIEARPVGQETSAQKADREHGPLVIKTLNGKTEQFSPKSTEASPKTLAEKKPAPGPTLKEGDKVSWEGQRGAKLSGTVRSIDAARGTAEIDTNQIVSLGGRIPIGRIETVKLDRLQWEASEAPRTPSWKKPAEKPKGISEQEVVGRQGGDELPANIDEISDVVRWATLPHVGLRVLADDLPDVEPGDVLPPSNDWIVGIKGMPNLTGTKADGGTSAIEAPRDDIYSELKHRLDVVQRYDGSRLVVIESHEAKPGRDFYEIRMLKPTVLAVFGEKPQPAPVPATSPATPAPAKKGFLFKSEWHNIDEAPDGIIEKRLAQVEAHIQNPNRVASLDALNKERLLLVQEQSYRKKHPMSFRGQAVDNESKIETEKSNGSTTSSPASASEGGREVSPAPTHGGGKLAGVEPRPSKEARGEAPTPASAGERSGTNGNRTPAVREEGTGAGPGEGNRLPEPTTAERGPRVERVKGKNQDWFSHPEDFSVDATPSTRLEWNTKALTILKNVLEKNQKLTDEDRDALAHYVGWGALDKVFNPGWGSDADMWHRGARALQELMTPEELAAARRSTQNAHYTSPQIVRSIWTALSRMGFKGGVVLEPSMGTGNFLGMMPKGIRNTSQAIGNELDPTTYNIAKLLYPSATTFNKDFVELMMPNDSVDLAVSNVPFGVNVYDPVYRKLGKPAIHDYFFVKSLDKVRPGGLLAYITSTYTLDKQSSTIRDVLADKADLLFALRLPQDTFDKSSGTAVSTDFIVLRKRAPRAEPGGEAFGGLRDVQAKYEPYFYDKAGTTATKQINEYYAEHPENVLGELVIGRGRTSQNPEMLVAKRTGDFEERLKNALDRVPRDGYQTKAKVAPILAADMDEQFAPDSLQEGNYAIDDKGAVRQRVHGKLVATDVNRDNNGNISHGLNERLKQLIGIRDATKGLMLSMRTLPDDAVSNKEIAQIQAKLSKQIEKYRDRHGWFSEKKTKDVFYEDPHYPLLLSLEDYDKTQKVGTPAEMLSKRTIFPEAKLTALSSDPKEAFYQVLGDRGHPDLEFMAGLSGKTVEEIAKPLVEQGLIFKEPNTHDWQVRSKYLSGYVRDKLADAQKAVAQGHKEFEPNVAALEKVQPPTVPINSGDPEKDIQVKLGATWISGPVVEQFAKDVLGSGYYASVKNAAGQWKVEGLGRSAEMQQFGGGGMPADVLLELALNLKQPVVKYSYKDEHGNIREAVDQDKTIAAKKAQLKLKEEFAKWARGHKTIGPALEKIYNDTMNNLVTPEHDGSHLTFAGMNKSVLRDGRLQPHQSDAVWRIVQDGRALLAHVVGAGKTYEMIASAMEMKRLGMIRKPMFAVPNHLVGQWAKDFLKLYPGAKILVPEKKDFEAVRRNRIMSKIATGNWDAVLLPHSQFNLMDISPEYQQKTLNKELDELEETYNAAKEAGEGKRSFTVKRLEKARDRLRSRLAELKDMKADKTIRFDDLGVDQLFVDEAHAYKNLSFYTKMERVAGLAQGDSKRAIRLKMKTDYLLEKHENRGVVFATGTPIQNTMAEMYNMTRYLAPDALEKAGIRYFDDWAANFGDTITAMELGVDGRSYKPRSKFARFTNIPELQQIFRSFADVKTKEDLNLPIPKIEGGKPQALIALPTPELEDYVKQLIERAQRCRGQGGSRPDPREDNMLKVTGDGRKAATDMRLIDPNYPDDPDSKINTVVKKAFEEWESGKSERLTQAIFLDNYQYLEDVGALYDEAGNVTKAGKETALLNLYRDMKDKLIAKGVPADEIAIIHDYDKQEQKTELFRKMNAGEVRILFGSTEKMGAGMNAQQRMKSLIDVDSPWRPGDLEQRHGRILRQGNMNDTVRIYHAVTKGTFDSYMIQTLKGKAEFINQVMSGKFKGRTMTDAAGDMVLSLEEMLAASSNNPDVKKKMELEAEVATLGALEREHDASLYRFGRDAETQRDYAARRETEAEFWKKIKGDWEKATAGDKFSFNLLGKKFAEYGDAADWIKDQDAPPQPFHFEINGVPGRFSLETYGKGEMHMNYTIGGQGGEIRRLENFPSLLASTYAYLNPKNVDSRIHFNDLQAKEATAKAEKLEVLSKKEGFEDAARLKAAKEELEAVKKRLGLSDDKAAMEQDVAAAVDSTPDKPEPGEEAEEPEEKSLKSHVAGESGSFEPGKIRDYINSNLKELRGARELERGTFGLEKRHEARVLRARDVLVGALKQYGKDALLDPSRYHHLENPSGEPIHGVNDDILDDVTLPIMDQNAELFQELRENGVPIENYVHRQVKGKGGWFDRIAAGFKGTGKGNLLSKSAPQAKGRTMMAIESPEGDRRVISIKGRKATMWDKGESTELGEIKNASGRGHAENETFPEGEPNSVFYDEGKIVEGPDGYDWKITQATTKEIEANTELRYYHNDVASALVSNLQLAKAVDAMHFVEAFKNSPEFEEIAHPEGKGMPPKGWRITQLPQFKGYYFEPHYADVLDRYAQRLQTQPSALDQVGSFMRVAMLLNPIMHPLNVGASWTVDRGLTGFLPTRIIGAARAGMRAVKAVSTQNEDFLNALDVGAPLQSHREATAKITQLFFDQLGEGLTKQEPWALKVAKNLGMAPITLIKALHNFSSRVAWISNDILFLQAAYERQGRGMDFREALDETGRTIPEYRIPAHILNSRTASKIMESKWATIFGAYHYGLLRSFGEVGKSALGLNERPAGGEGGRAADVAKGWDRLALIGLVAMALYPLLDEMAKKLIGDEHARAKRFGPFAVIDAWDQARKGSKSVTEAAQTSVTPAPQTKAMAEMASNREFYSGRQIFNPHDDWQTQAHQLFRYLESQAGQIGQAQRASESESGKRKFAWQQVGVQFKPTRAEKVARDIAHSKMGTEAPEPGESEMYGQRHDVLDALRQGDSGPLTKAEDKGDLSSAQAKRLRHRARLTPLEDTVYNFTYAETMKVLDAAKKDGNQEEVDDLEKALARKRRNMWARHEQVPAEVE